MAKRQKLTAAQLKNMRAGYASAMKAHLESRYPALDSRIEVARMAIVSEAIKEVAALQIPDGPNAKQLRNVMLHACYQTIAEFFSERGYIEQKIVMAHPERVRQEQERQAQAKSLEQAQLKLAIKTSVIEALRELGFGEQQES